MFESQPDEIIEKILYFIPKEDLIQVSSTSKQFRRLWKETHHGILCKMKIKLNYSFKKLSYSLKDQVDVGKFIRDGIDDMINKLEKQYQANLHCDLISGLKRFKLSENFNQAISKIDRFDYGKEDSVCWHFRYGIVYGFELSFGQFGILNYWEWHADDADAFYYEKYEGIMETKLKELKLTNEEWDTIFKYIEEYCTDMFILIRADQFGYMDRVQSMFDEHEFKFNVMLTDN